MNTICLVMDRLHAGYLGAYGNAWIETPALDRLAVESFVADQYLVDSPRLETLYRSYWHGRHAAADGGPPDACSALAEILAGAGVNPTLLTDEPAVARHPSARGFVETIELERPEASPVADELEETHLARSFARMIDWLDSAREPFLLWSHLSGLGGPWDAPLDFRRRYAEPEDPEPPDHSRPPCRMLEEDYDPDEILGACQAYAGQVTLWDTCLGALLEMLESHPLGQTTLLVVTSARGFPLGEHRRLGPADEALYGELVHVPLVMRFPDRQCAAVRTQALVQPADLWATILDWWQMTDLPPAPAAKSLLPLAREEVRSVRDRLLVVDGHERAIRTPAWYLRDSDRPELYAKPDDRWEANDVADRCADVVERLREAMRRYEAGLQAGELSDLPPLEEILLTGID
jgi:arylsulfatase A-like enzyme